MEAVAFWQNETPLKAMLDTRHEEQSKKKFSMHRERSELPMEISPTIPVNGVGKGPLLIDPEIMIAVAKLS